jgi:ABC-type antimicrobial peptide transport system permease subunit
VTGVQTCALPISFTGGAIGFVLGTLLARVLGESVFGTPANLRMVLLPIVMGLATAVVLLGSVIPLRRAARFEPAPILRGE